MRLRGWRLRGWRKTRRGTLRLKPDPVFYDPVTYDRFEAVCLALGIDPDKAFSGEISLHDLPAPDMKEAQHLFDLMLVNSRVFDPRRMEPGRLKAVLALLVNEFFFTSGSTMPRSRLMPSL